eukprot:g4393.t1
MSDPKPELVAPMGMVFAFEATSQVFPHIAHNISNINMSTLGARLQSTGKVLLVLQKDRRLAAQVLKKALAEQRLEGPGTLAWRQLRSQVSLQNRRLACSTACMRQDHPERLGGEEVAPLGDAMPVPDAEETAVRYLTAAAQSFEQAAVAPPAPGDAETSSPPVTLRGAELRRALQAERQALQLQRDRRQRALRRAEELSNLSAAQATSLEQELRGLDGCGSSSSEWKAEVRALQDAERVFAGEPISVPRPRRAIRGAAPLSRMEAAAEALGVSIS